MRLTCLLLPALAAATSLRHLAPHVAHGMRFRGGADIDLEEDLEADADAEALPTEEAAAATGEAATTSDGAAAGADVEIPASRALSRAEITEKLNAIPTFCVQSEEGGIVAMKLQDDPNPAICWFLDPREAQAVLSAAEAGKPDANMRLGCHGLGAVFEQCNGWGDAKEAPKAEDGSDVNLKLMGSAPLVKEVGPRLVELLEKQGMEPGSWQVPIFMCEKLQSRRIVPVFFNPREIAKLWEKSGREAKDLPQDLQVMDLRMLVANMQTASSPWELIQFVGSEEGATLAQECQAAQKQAA